MKAFHETLRHDHPLTANDWVLEIGAHMGHDSKILAEKYGCHIVAYEPISDFFRALTMRFAGSPWEHLIQAVHAGVGKNTRREMFGVHGDRSGFACAAAHQESVEIVPISSVLEKWGDDFRRTPALVQINAEGGEYEILPALIYSGLIKTIPRIQVQFHSVVPDAAIAQGIIAEVMAVTHDYLWQPGELDTGWVGWERRHA